MKAIFQDKYGAPDDVLETCQRAVSRVLAELPERDRKAVEGHEAPAVPPVECPHSGRALVRSRRLGARPRRRRDEKRHEEHCRT